MLPGTPYLNTFNANAVWKRIADGPSAPVRLVLTPADPEDPACTTVVLTTSIVPGSCDGPIGLTTDDSDPQRVRPMAMSADGRRVVIATGNPRTNVQSSLIPDAYVVDLRDGVSRKAGTRRISVGPDPTTGAGVTDVALSPTAGSLRSQRLDFAPRRRRRRAATSRLRAPRATCSSSTGGRHGADPGPELVAGTGGRQLVRAGPERERPTRGIPLGGDEPLLR